MFKDDPTRKQVNSVKTLIKQLYDQAVMDDVDVVCPLLQMDTYFKTKDYRHVESDIYLHTKSDFLTVLCF